MTIPMYFLLALTITLSVRQWLTLRSGPVLKAHLVQVKRAETSLERTRVLDAIAHRLQGPLAALNWIAGSAAYIGLVCTLLELLFGLRAVGQSNPSALLVTAIAALEATLVGLITAIVASAAHAVLSRKFAEFGKILEDAK